MGIESYVYQEINQQKSYSKKLNKYVTIFDYIDKILIILSVTSSRISIISFASAIGVPAGIASACFTLIFSITTGIIKKLLNITRKKKKRHDKILMLAKSKLNSIESLISQALNDLDISHEELQLLQMIVSIFAIIAIAKQYFCNYCNCKTIIANDSQYFWINLKDFEAETERNWQNIFNKYGNSSTLKYRKELTPNIQFQPDRIFTRNDLFEKIIKSCKATNAEFLMLKEKLGLCPYEVICDEKEFILMPEI